ncbi:MAG TPA: hypothetical protein VLL95_07500 [Phnomibacter sp.]|jgi:hypothetical protein|nr:hypothetical protein [Phnomibacter sp.]
MIWLILIGSMLLGIMLIRFTYKIEKRRMDKDREATAAQMKEFMDMLNQKKEKK